VESWGGAIGGNCSGDLNTLFGMMAGYFGSYNRSLGYANTSDKNNLWPQMDGRCRWLLAWYSGSWHYQAWGPMCIGQQYTDGQTQFGAPPGFPFASAPFGNCDHNGTIDYTSKQLAALLGIKPIDNKPKEPEMIIIRNPATGGVAVVGTPKPYHLGDPTTIQNMVNGGVPYVGDIPAGDYDGLLASYDNSDSAGIEQRLDAILARLGNPPSVPAPTTAPVVPSQTLPITGSITIGNPA
jgi:hypothetical protein